jgi:hypothetical protein
VAVGLGLLLPPAIQERAIDLARVSRPAHRRLVVLDSWRRVAAVAARRHFLAGSLRTPTTRVGPKPRTCRPGWTRQPDCQLAHGRAGCGTPTRTGYRGRIFRYGQRTGERDGGHRLGRAAGRL